MPDGGPQNSYKSERAALSRPQALQVLINITTMDSFTNFATIVVSVPTEQETGGGGSGAYCTIA